MEGPIPIVQMREQVGEVKGLCPGSHSATVGMETLESDQLTRLLHREGVRATGRG